MDELKTALEALGEGRIILVHDGGKRENEIDLVVNAIHVRPETIRQLRNDAGGLICLAISRDIADELGLPFMTDLMEASGNETLKDLTPEKTPYGDRPAFSIAINHKDTFTGITDNDRALTIGSFGQLSQKDDKTSFTKDYYAPGHVPLLIAKDIGERRGHTELSIELAKRAGLPETMVLCEMMCDDCNALSREDAKEYAQKHGLAFLDGSVLYD
ncbi:3,4-dihydroxy-2-butanone-4-phosphate synthase [Candidatus Altiarchaeota archaeon]